jgi:hypothetical protein
MRKATSGRAWYVVGIVGEGYNTIRGMRISLLDFIDFIIQLLE